MMKNNSSLSNFIMSDDKPTEKKPKIKHNRTKYCFSLNLTADDTSKQEQIVQNFLFKHATKVRFGISEDICLQDLTKGQSVYTTYLFHSDDANFLPTKNGLKSDFIKVIRAGRYPCLDFNFIEFIQELPRKIKMMYVFRKSFFTQFTFWRNPTFQLNILGYYEKENHHLYVLSSKIKKIIKEETLIFGWTPLGRTKLYGYHNPCFYKNKELICSIISHEGFGYLYLTPEEKVELEQQLFEFEE